MARPAPPRPAQQNPAQPAGPFNNCIQETLVLCYSLVFILTSRSLAVSRRHIFLFLVLLYLEFLLQKHSRNLALALTSRSSCVSRSFGFIYLMFLLQKPRSCNRSHLPLLLRQPQALKFYI